MKSSLKSSARQMSSLIYNYLFYGILLFGLAIRMIYLSSDPPIDLAKGQSLWTDPSQYVFFARNFIIFGNMDLFAPSNLTFFKYSLMSFISIPIFFLFGSGFWQSNLVSVIISFSAVIIFSQMIKKSIGNIAGIIAATFAGLSYIYVMHNRVPYLENASVALLVFSSFILLFGNHSRIHLLLSGFIYSSSLLIGKTLAIMVLPAFIITLWSISRTQHGPRKTLLPMAVYFSLGLVLFAVLALLIFYLPNYSSSKQYLYENVINYYGFPDGLKSIPGFIKSLFTFDLVNFDNRFFDRMPIITICSLLCFILIKCKSYAKERTIITFFGAWLVSGIIFLSPWNYRPIRYEIYLVLPMVALSAIFLQNLLVGNIEFKKYSFITSLFIFSLVAFHIYFEISKASLNQQYAFWKIFTLSILISVLVSSIIYFSVAYFIRRHYLIRLSMIIGLLALFLIGELRLYGKWIKKATFAIDYVNKNLPRQIDKDAILIGPYAQTITLGNELRSEIYYFGAYARNDFLFDIMPATHVAYEIGMGSKSGNELKFEEYYPEIKKQSLLIDSYLIGRYYVNIYNINDATVNTKNHVYHWSNFEKAMKYYAESEPDSALKYFEYAGREDHCARAYLYKGNLYLSRGLYEQARHEYQEGLQEDCYDPKFWYLYSISCQRSGLMAESERARNMALKYEPFPGFINNLKF